MKDLLVLRDKTIQLSEKKSFSRGRYKKNTNYYYNYIFQLLCNLNLFL